MITSFKIGHDNEKITSKEIQEELNGEYTLTGGHITAWNNLAWVNHDPQPVTPNMVRDFGNVVDGNNRIDTNNIQFLNERYHFLQDKLVRLTMVTNRRSDGLGIGNVILPTTYEHRIMMIFNISNDDIPLLQQLMDSNSFNRPIDYKTDALVTNYNNQSNYTLNGLFISNIHHLPLIDYNYYGGTNIEVHIDFSCDQITIS